MKIKKSFLVLFFSLLGILIFIFVIKQVGWRSVWGALSLLSFWELITVLVVGLAGFLFSVLRWREILESQYNKKVPFSLLFRAHTVGFSLGYLTPSAYFGGEPLKAIILKEETDIDWERNIFSVIVDRVLELIINALVVLVGIVYLFVFFDFSFWISLTLIAILVFVIFLIGFFLYRSIDFKEKPSHGFFTVFIKSFWPKKVKRIGGVVENIEKIDSRIIYFFSHQVKYLTISIVYGLISRGLSIFSSWLIIFFIGVHITILQLFGFIALTAVVYFLPIPGGLGAHEASQAVIFSAFGLGDYMGIAFSLVLRVIFLLASAIGLIILLYTQIKRWGRKLVNFSEKWPNKLNNRLN